MKEDGKTILEMDVSQIACKVGLDPKDKQTCLAISSFLERFPETPSVTDFLPCLLENHLINNGVSLSKDRSLD